MMALRRSCEVWKGQVFAVISKEKQLRPVSMWLQAGKPHQDNLTSRTGTSGAYVLIVVKVQLVNEFGH